MGRKKKNWISELLFFKKKRRINSEVGEDLEDFGEYMGKYD